MTLSSQRNGARRRFLCVHLLDDFSGSAKVCAEVVAILEEEGHDVRVWVGSAGEAGFIRRSRPSTRLFWYRTSRNRIPLLLWYFMAQLQLMLRVFCHCVVNRPAAVYVSTILPIGAVVGARLALTRLICHVHEAPARRNMFLRSLERLVGLLADHVVCVSQFVAVNGGYSRRNHDVVYNSLAKREWDTARAIAAARGEIPHRPFGVVMLCSLKWYKGIDSFLEIAKRAHREGLACGFTLVLNGDVSSCENFAQSNAASNVNFVLRPPSVYRYYLESDLVVNLSHPEGWIESFGLTLLEGMATGLPAVSPTIGGCVELFEHGRGGWHISSRDLTSLYGLIESLEGDPAIWRRASAAAQLAASRFGPEKFRTHMLAVLVGQEAGATSYA